MNESAKLKGINDSDDEDFLDEFDESQHGP